MDSMATTMDMRATAQSDASPATAGLDARITVAVAAFVTEA
jgi:hypothetical protein